MTDAGTIRFPKFLMPKDLIVSFGAQRGQEFVALITVLVVWFILVAVTTKNVKF